MSDLLSQSKAAISALGVASETASANKWLVEFESSSESWMIADKLLQEDSQPYCFFGARIIHSKIRRDFRQLDTRSAGSLMESLVGHVIRLSQKPVLELNVCRFLCLAISALALQLNSPGIVAQILQWLNPILSSQPIILLELLLVLPEECYDRNVLVDRDRRDSFAQQLCHSGMEVFGFLSSLRAAAPSLAVQLQLLKCLERWIYNVDMPLSYIAAQPIFRYALEAVVSQQLNEEAVEVIISLVRKFGYGYGSAETALLFPLVLQHILPLSAVWKQQVDGFSRVPRGDVDEDSCELCRNICRTFTEVAEAFLPHLLAVAGDAVPAPSPEAHRQLKDGVNALLQQLLDCASFPYSAEVSRIPLKLFYDLSVYVLDYRERCQCNPHDYENMYGDAPEEPIQPEHRDAVEGLVGALYAQLLQTALRQMQLPAEVLQGRAPIDDETEVQRQEWSDLVCDCCHAIGAEQALRGVCSAMQTEIGGAQPASEQSGAAQVAPWARVEACLSALKEVVPFVDEGEAAMMPPLVGFLCSTAPTIALPVLVRVAVELVGCCDKWLRRHPESLPPLWQMLVVHMEVAHCSSAACRSMTAVLSLSKYVPGLPIFDLHNTLLSMRAKGVLASESDNTLLEGICVALSSRAPDELRTGFQTIIKPICSSLNANLQCNPGAANNGAVMADIHLLTTAVQFTAVSGVGLSAAHPVIEVFPSLQPLMARAMEVVRSEAVCEKVCRFYKYAIRASSLGRDDSRAKCVHPGGFVVYLDSMATHLRQMFEEKFFACFLYCGSIMFSEFGNVVNSSQSRHQDAGTRGRVNEVLFRMLGGFSELMFSRLKSLADFDSKPDVVEEYFYMLARVLSHCPQQFIAFACDDGAGASESRSISARMSGTLEAALTGLSVSHKDAQKGILNFIQKLVTSLRGLKSLVSDGAGAAQIKDQLLAQRVMTFEMILEEFVAGPLLNHLFQGLAGGSVELQSVDEDHGSVLDVLWSLRISLKTEKFRELVSRALENVPKRSQDIAANVVHFPNSLLSSADPRTGAVVSVREREFNGLIREFHRKCTADDSKGGSR